MIRLYLDFDGTITLRDVGDELFMEFGDFHVHSAALMSGETDVRSYYKGVVQSLRKECTPEALKSFVEHQEVDSGLLDLLEFCKKRDIEVLIVSDGFDSYINPILSKHVLSNSEIGIGDLKVMSNTLEYRGLHWVPAFPGATESCSCFCASCKRNAVIGTSTESDVTIYVGDGMSDECAIQYCDVVFAKHSLAAYCNSHRIPHHPFKNLSDVQRILASKLATGELRHRRQAAVARAIALRSE
ncbi:MAG: MtnX-like HAD-IB family phosphatase [Ignavibacteria bacterium]|nr:MtnX-like HAD-IB family phosphatase [Ignavibacteria bacterium]